MLLLADAEQAGGLVEWTPSAARPGGGVLAGRPDARRGASARMPGCRRSSPVARPTVGPSPPGPPVPARAGGGARPLADHLRQPLRPPEASDGRRDRGTAGRGGRSGSRRRTVRGAGRVDGRRLLRARAADPARRRHRAAAAPPRHSRGGLSRGRTVGARPRSRRAAPSRRRPRSWEDSAGGARTAAGRGGGDDRRRARAASAGRRSPTVDPELWAAMVGERAASTTRSS